MKNILVVGGTGGIGREIVKNLCKNNKVVVWGRDDSKFDDLKNFVDNGENAENISFQKVDVVDESQVDEAISNIGLEKIDVLINAAAVVWPIGKTAEIDAKKFRKAFDINFFGTLNCFKAVLPLLQKSTKGKIINFSGGGSAFARENHSPYAASKTACVRLTENIAVEYPDVDINIIAPGAHKTPLWNDETFDEEPENWGDMGELLEFIDFLISDESNGISGRFLHFKDPRSNMLEDIKKNPDLYTLRRIDDFKFINK